MSCEYLDIRGTKEDDVSNELFQTTDEQYKENERDGEINATVGIQRQAKGHLT